MQFIAVLLLLAFIAGSIRLLDYCLTNGRVRFRLFLAAWFLVLSVLFLRAAWVNSTIERHGDSFGQAIARAELEVLSFGAAIGLGALALGYAAPTIWRALQRRRLASTPGVAPDRTTAPMRWLEAVLFTVIVLPLLGVTWLILVYNYPALIVRRQSDQPLPWLKATTNPPTLENEGIPLTWTEISLYTQSPSGKWIRIGFPYESHSRRLAVLSPDSVLITWPASMAPNTFSVYNNFVGAVYRNTAVEDKNELESQTDPINWYHIPWMHDPM
jgi:hypothetical protein